MPGFARLIEESAAPPAAIEHNTTNRTMLTSNDKAEIMKSLARMAAPVSDQVWNAVLLKPNQAGTITAMHRPMGTARAAGWGTVGSGRSGETEDVTIVHLATGWDAGQLKVGSFARSERMSKWNEALRIGEALGPAATFAGIGALPTHGETGGDRSQYGPPEGTSRVRPPRVLRVASNADACCFTRKSLSSGGT